MLEQVADTSNAGSVVRVRPPRQTDISRGSAGATSRLMWVVGYIVLLVAIALRLPLVLQWLVLTVPEAVKVELPDERLLRLALTTGIVLFALIFAVVMALYFSLAALLERKLIARQTRALPWCAAGPFFLIAVMSTIPVHFASVLFGIVRPQAIPGYWVYFPVVAGFALATRYRLWAQETTLKKLVIVLAGLGTSLVVAVG